MLVLLRTFLLGATGLVSERRPNTRLTSVRVLFAGVVGHREPNPAVETEQPLPSRQRWGVGYPVQPQSNPDPRVSPLT